VTKKAIWLSGILLAGSLAWAAQGLNVRTGLWQMTYTMQNAGGPTMPKDVMDQLTPEQHARLAAAQQARAGMGPKTRTTKTCVTDKDLQRGAFRSDKSDDGEDCKYTMTAQTATLQEGTTSCGGGKVKGQVRIEALGPEKVQGRMNMTGPGFSSSMQMSGTWLGASCAGAKKDD
jgi:hypothetical protein